MADTKPPGPLTYTGQVATPYILKTFPPTTAYNKFNVPTIWVDYLHMNAYVLVSVDLGTAEWLQIGSFPGALATLTTPDTTVVVPTAGNINFLNGTGMNITGSGSNITFNSTVSSSITFVEDAGSAAPAGGNLNILGTLAQGLTTSGAGSTVTLSNENASTTQKGVSLLATDLETIAGVNTTKIVTPADLTAKLGTQTNHGVALGATTTSPLSYTSSGTTGQAFISGGAASDPDWGVLGTAGGGTGNSTYTNGQLLIGNSVGGILTKNTLSSSDGSITITNGAGTIDLVNTATAIGVVQYVYTSLGTILDCTTVIPEDNTIPQITEGDQVLTLAITPKKATNLLKIQFNTTCGKDIAGTAAAAALFLVGTANALSATINGSTAGSSVLNMVLDHTMVAGVTTPLTFSVRVGPAFAGTHTYVNGNGGIQYFNGVCNTSLSITEIQM